MNNSCAEWPLWKQNVLSNNSQRRVNRLQGKQLWLIVLSCPCTKLLVLCMTSISQCFKQVSIATNATAMLGRTRARSIQTAWHNHLLCHWHDIFYSNHMAPIVSKIICVDKARPFITSNGL